MHWINIEEKLPNLFENVLVAQSTGAVFIGRYEGGDEWESANSYAIEPPTHWMPLPEPPKED